MAKTKEKAKSKIGSVNGQIVKARKAGDTWATIAEAMDLSVGKTIFIHECATVPDGERFTGTDAAVAKKIVKARDSGMSWGQIAARAGWPEGRCKRLYFEDGGGNVNVHRGGRYPQGEDRGSIRPDLDEVGTTKTKPKGAKKAVKKAGAKKASAKKGGSKVADMTPAQFVKHAKGKTVTTTDGDKIKVSKISHSNGLFEVEDAEGDEWAFEISEVKLVK